ncbi:nuclear transport factor 2 family protein [Celeribacter neptunius]|uniref:SnoaL-like domain-containing protein n=1 Tax=Celeribacter neptunius TaxID=588602 RepID=A0A1I3KPW3_9RHOB|nr:nuclear transport factor 2 family protein [Celeribacter neptunius]SFI74155.1 SnoaL-like domain-containing protein [Celeribacter neptunius]
MTGLELLEAWYEKVWVQADIEAVAEFFDVEALASGIMTDFAAHLEDMQALVPAVLQAVREVSVSFEDSMEQDDRVWARVTLHAKKAHDMTPIHIPGQVMIRIKNGKIVEAHNNFDFISYFEQMGNLPQDSIALMLAGEVLC